MKTKQRVILLGSLIGTTFVHGLTLMSTRVQAEESSVDNVTITVPSACSMSADGMTSHNAEINNGIYKDDIGTTTFQVFCNDSGGFSVYAVGFTGEEFGNTVLTSQKLGSSYDIVTGTATSAGDSDISNWAMRVQTNPNANYPVAIVNEFDVYHAVPEDYVKVISRENPTDIGASATGATFTTTYSAYISKTQLAGTYTGQVKYTLVHPASELPIEPQVTPSGFIGYYPNASRVTDTMSDQAIETTDTMATLWVSNFKRKGYGFAGWSTTYDYSDPNGFYGPNADIDFTAGAYTGDNNGLSLYAYWVKSVGTFQEWDGCNNLNIGEVTALTDERNDGTYAIAKLADGNCWTIENLRLGHNATITTSNTHSSNNSFGGAFTTLAEAETDTFNNTGTANTLYNSSNINGSYAEYRYPRYNDNNTRQGSMVNEMQSPSDNVRSYGHYYTWAASIANTEYFSQNNQNASAASLCPKNWSLPLAGNDIKSLTSDYRILAESVIGTAPNDTWVTNRSRYSNKDNTEGATASKLMREFPTNFVYSGSISGSSNSGKGVNGYYWSATSASSNYAYSFGINATMVYPGTNFNSKTEGVSIRCIKR